MQPQAALDLIDQSSASERLAAREALEPVVAEMAGIPASSIGVRPALDRILAAIRTHLHMDVAFISEVSKGRRHFRYVSSNGSGPAPTPGSSDPAEHSYCMRVIDGRLQELIPDACVNLEALTLAATRQLPIGAHLSVPIRLADGEIYGTFCCFSHAPNVTLTERDLDVMRVFADMVGEQIQEEINSRRAKQLIDDRIVGAINSQALGIVFQPIYELDSQKPVGFECLSRFASEPYRPPNIWFDEAAAVGRGTELEAAAIRLALSALDHLPNDIYLTVNSSPETIVRGHLPRLLEGLPLERIVIEVTEHHAIERYEDISDVVRPLQAKGLRLAIDDAGAGYASFRHVLNLHPHIVKLDISITRAIDSDRARRALAAALCGFAKETGCKIVAEGIETAGELRVIRELGIGKAQGYLLGKPMSLNDAQSLFLHPISWPVPPAKAPAC